MLLAAACQGQEGPVTNLPEGETESNLEKGAPAPPFTLPSAHGRRISLADYRGDRPVLLYFSMGPG